MTILASIAVAAAAMLAPARIQARLNALQSTLSPFPDPPPKYVVYDDRTIIAAYRWQDDDGPNGLLVAYRVRSDGTLRRLADFRYGDNPTALELEPPYVLVTGTTGVVEILSWDGKHFSPLGETQGRPSLIDIDGDGVPEVLTRTGVTKNECGADVATAVIDRFDDDTLTAMDTPDLQAVIEIRKTADGPETFDRDVALRDDAPPTVVFHVVKKRGVDVEIANMAVDQPVPVEARCFQIHVTATGPKDSAIAILVRSPRP